VLTIPTCSPLGPTSRTSRTRIRSLMRGSTLILPPRCWVGVFDRRTGGLRCHWPPRHAHAKANPIDSAPWCHRHRTETRRPRAGRCGWERLHLRLAWSQGNPTSRSVRKDNTEHSAETVAILAILMRPSGRRAPADHCPRWRTAPAPRCRPPPRPRPGQVRKPRPLESAPAPAENPGSIVAAIPDR
jgi:hypothetical protein